MTLKNKIVALFAFSLSAVLALSLYFIYDAVRDELLKENLQNMLNTARVITIALEEGGIEQLQKASSAVIGRGGRVTFVDNKGVVQFDSSEVETDNHLKRPEIWDAAKNGSGSALRYSNTLRTHMHYYAVRVGDAEQGGFLRVAYPIELLTLILRALFKKIIFNVFLLFILALLFWFWVARRFFIPLEQIVQRAGNMESGETLFPFFRDPEFQKLSAALSDMSVRLQNAGQDIHARREELARLVEALPVGIILIGHNRAIRYLNSVARKLLGSTEDIGKGSSVERLIPNGEIYGMLDSPDGRASFFLPYSNGSWVEIETSTLENGRLMILKDTTEERGLEEARRNFVIEASHDLQTPLTSIRAAAELLLENAQTEEDSRLLNTLLRQQERMTALIDDLLLLVKLDFEGTNEERQEEDLVEILTGLLEEFREDPNARRIEFEACLPEHAPIWALRSEISRSFSNLLDNAVRKCGEKWKDNEGGKVSIALFSKEKRWIVVVADNGPGVAPEIQDRIFRSFYSAGNRGQWSGSVHGLGLSITSRIVGVHGGEIRLLNVSPLGGAAFEVLLPEYRRFLPEVIPPERLREEGETKGAEET